MKNIIIIIFGMIISHSLNAQTVDPHLDVEGNAKIRGKIDIMIAPGDSSVFIGVNAGMNDDGSDNNNTFIGANAGLSNITGRSNSFFGRSAGMGNTAGDRNSFFGRSAGMGNTTGDRNSFFGLEAGFSNITGKDNSFFGEKAGFNNITGDDNSFFGRDAGVSNTTGDENSFFGLEAGFHNTTGEENSFFGIYSGRENTSGGDNSFFGARAGQDNTSGDENSFFGARAGQDNTSGEENSFFGAHAGEEHNNTKSTMLGHNAQTMDSLDRAIAIGFEAEVGCHNCAVIGGTGANAVKVGIGTSEPTAELHVEGNAKIRGKIDIITATGDSSVFIGVNAGMNDDGSDNNNTFVGAHAGLSNTSGSKNSFFGRDAGTNNTSGFGNSFFGQSSGNNHNNQRSTMLGFSAQTLGSLSRSIAIGHNALVACSNCAVIGGTGADSVLVGIGTTTPTSDLYIKQSDVSTSAPTTGGITLEDDDTTNKWQINAGAGSLNFAFNGVYKALILNNGNYFDLDASFRGDTDQTKSRASNLKSMDDVLNKVNKLQPSTKQSDKSNRTEWGFVAEEVAKVFPEIAPIVNGQRGIIPHYFGILSIKAIQEQQVIIEEQALENIAQEQAILKLEKQVEKLSHLIEELINTQSN